MKHLDMLDGGNEVFCFLRIFVQKSMICLVGGSHMIYIGSGMRHHQIPQAETNIIQCPNEDNFDY